MPTRLPFVLVALASIHGCADGTGPTTSPAPPADVVPSSVGDVPPEVGPWLDAHAKPVDGTHLSLPHGDLEFLRGVVGDARIVALGENTHGTRDFFEMKARILRFLVEEMGFDTFAMEATWPESRRLDRYVRTGEGDAEELLSGLYFFTWNTESVLEMIKWMRDHNEAGGDLGFHGFDMQYPGMALHNVREYVRQVDPRAADAMSERLDCLTRFANDHARNWPEPRYSSQTDAYRTACGAALEEARGLLLENRKAYEAAAGPDAFEVALQSLRVAVQYHLLFTGEQTRDESMAENTEWISRRIGPEGRVVLWAHNYHVSTQPGAQGSYLRQVFGDGMVVVGFSHERGRFTARHQVGDRFAGISEFDLGAPRPDSYEHYLSSAAAPRFVLDLRRLDTDSAESSWLAGTRPFRFIGCCYDPDTPGDYWHPWPLVDWFDVMIHLESTRPTVLLPFRFPDSW